MACGGEFTYLCHKLFLISFISHESPSYSEKYQRHGFLFIQYFPLIAYQSYKHNLSLSHIQSTILAPQYCLRYWSSHVSRIPDTKKYERKFVSHNTKEREREDSNVSNLLKSQISNFCQNLIFF